MKIPSPRRGLKRGLAALAVGALALGALVATPLAANAAPAPVTGVTFDWGINNESSGGSYFGVCNFLSAGVAGDTGRSRVWSQTDGFFKSSEGNTTIVKPTANDGTGEQPVIWANRCLLPDETYVPPAPIPLPPNYTPPTPGRLVQPTSNNPLSYTQSRVKIANGTGTVDPTANTAEIQWDGSFTVVYYGGMTYWSVTDPKLVVHADGTGTVTALVTGYGADMDNPEVWNKLADHPDLTIANLSNVDVTADGFTVTPNYLGVEVPEDIAGRNAPVTGQPWSGAFPADFLRFQILTGQSSYWYTTAGGANSIQPRKAANPLKVSYTVPVSAPSITTQPTAQSVVLGQQATFTVAATGTTGYQWQSAAPGSDTWHDVTGATAASVVVDGTTTNAKQYRVVVTGAGGSTTSAAAALTVTVPTPTVTVSKTTDVNAAGETVTVTGSGFLANAPLTNGAPQRGPLAGKFSGAYIAFGRFADVWKASQGAASTARPADRSNTKWGVHAANMAQIGGAESGAVEIKADGTFQTTLTLTKDYADVPPTGNYGVYTYPAGSSGYAAFETYTPITFTLPTPDAPAAPSATLGADGTSMDVSWTAPNDHGEAISGYDVTLTPGVGVPQTVNIPGGTLAHSFTGLVRGQRYSATVVAKNAGGSSPASPASTSVVIPAVAPDAPAAPTVTAAGTDSVNVSWVAPAVDGGSPITGYDVTVTKGGQVVKTASVTGTTTTITGLERSTEYSVTVAAKNAVGSSAASAPTSVTTSAEKPDALAAPTVTAASGTSINVQWIAPADGGSPITAYVVKVLAGAGEVKTVEVDSVTATTVDGLQNGTEYTVTVAAKNAQGTGAASPASAPVRTFSAPSAPVVTAQLVGTSGITATWSAPADGGSTITGYTAVLKKDGAAVQTALVRGTTAEFGSLTPGGVYTVVVTATNAVGMSSAGVSASVTVPAVAPSAPQPPVLAAGADGTSATVTWAAPTSDGGSPILGYGVALLDVDDEQIVTQELGADARSATFAGLAKGEYRALVVAKNAVAATPSEPSTGVELAGPAPSTVPANVSESVFVGEAGGDAKITIDGHEVEINVGVDRANTWVGVTVHSDPRFLGWFLVGADGFARTTLPADLSDGVHRLVVQDADGNVLGYREFRIGTDTAPSPAGQGKSGQHDGLAATGANGDLLGWSVFASLMLLMGAGAVLVARRKSARV